MTEPGTLIPPGASGESCLGSFLSFCVLPGSFPCSWIALFCPLRCKTAPLQRASAAFIQLGERAEEGTGIGTHTQSTAATLGGRSDRSCFAAPWLVAKCAVLVCGRPPVSCAGSGFVVVRAGGWRVLGAKACKWVRTGRAGHCRYSATPGLREKRCRWLLARALGFFFLFGWVGWVFYFRVAGTLPRGGWQLWGTALARATSNEQQQATAGNSRRLAREAPCWGGGDRTNEMLPRRRCEEAAAVAWGDWQGAHSGKEEPRRRQSLRVGAAQRERD